MNATEADLPLVSSIADFSNDRPCLITPCARLADIRTVICGQSHNVALWRALVEPDDDGGRTRATAIALERGIASLPRTRGGPTYYEMVTRVGRDRNVVLVWIGNQYIADFLMMPCDAFDVVPCGYGDASVMPGVQVVPESMLRAHFAASVATIGEMLAALGRPPGLKRIVLGIPPPLPDDMLVKRHMAIRKGFFADKAQELGVDPVTVSLAPPALRRKLWFILMTMYREEAERNGALFLPFPPGAADANGFLKPAFSAEDGTHANVRYGRLMIEHLAPYLAEDRP